MSGPNNSIVLRTVYALDPLTNAYISSGKILVTDGLGGTSWNDSLSTLTIAGGPILNNLPSTIQYFSTTIYANTQAFSGLSSMSTDMYHAISSLSTAIGLNLPGGVTQTQLFSTVRGLGSSGYVSTPDVYAIISSTTALASVGSNTVSSIAGQLSNFNIYDISTINSVIQSQTTSSIIGLGSVGYLSTPALTSSMQGIGSLGYISSYATLISTVGGLGTAGYVSTASLVSTVANLQQFYNSNSGVTNVSLISTINGIGSLGYVSTSSLISTTESLFNSRTNVRFDTTGSVTTVGGTNTFFNTTTVVYISSFLMSSMTYSGNQGQQFNATNVPGLIHDMQFSTASINLAGFSNYIASNSRVTIDIYPNIAFSKLATGASNIAVLPISTFLQLGQVYLLSTTVTSYLNVTNTRVLLESGIYVDSSNFFTTPIKIPVPTGSISNFGNPYSVVHYMPSSLNNGIFQNALHSNVVTPFFGSTGSVFVSVQNLPT
jgi:hypothetical protein